MKRVVIMNHKDRPESPVEVFSNLKILLQSYPGYSYNTLNNYLSKMKVPYDNEQVRIERKVVITVPMKEKKII